MLIKTCSLIAGIAYKCTHLIIKNEKQKRIRSSSCENMSGRKPMGIETMLHMYLMQIWFNLSDEGINRDKKWNMKSPPFAVKSSIHFLL